MLIAIYGAKKKKMFGLDQPEMGTNAITTVTKYDYTSWLDQLLLYSCTQFHCTSSTKDTHVLRLNECLSIQFASCQTNTRNTPRRRALDNKSIKHTNTLTHWVVLNDYDYNHDYDYYWYTFHLIKFTPHAFDIRAMDSAVVRCGRFAWRRWWRWCCCDGDAAAAAAQKPCALRTDLWSVNEHVRRRQLAARCAHRAMHRQMRHDATPPIQANTNTPTQRRRQNMFSRKSICTIRRRRLLSVDESSTL